MKDSIKLVGSELIIENQSRNVSGFLFNGGDGRTTFKRLQLVKIGDHSLAIAGQDTLAVNFGQGASAPVLQDPDVLLSAISVDSTNMRLKWWQSDADLYESPRIALIGDSQCKGDYTSSYGNSISGRLQSYIYAIAANARVTNYCENGYNSRQLAPNGSNGYVDNMRNITKAIADGNNIVILMNTSNDFSPNSMGGELSLEEAMANTLLIEDACIKAGVHLIVVSSFPRTANNPSQREKLRKMSENLSRKFGERCAYVYHILNDADHPDQIKPELQTGDGIHLNDMGSLLVSSAVRDVLTNFFGSNMDVVKYILQRSAAVNADFEDFQVFQQNRQYSTILPKDEFYYRARIQFKDGYLSKWSNVVKGSLNEPTPGNKPPIVALDGPLIVMLPQDSITLTVNASDPDGTIAGYSWTKIMGSIASFRTPDAATTVLANLQEGTYIVRCTVTDDQGRFGAADVKIIVRPANYRPDAAKFNFNNAPQQIAGWIDVSGGPLTPQNSGKSWTDNNADITITNISNSETIWGANNFSYNSGNDNGEMEPDEGGYVTPPEVTHSSWYSNNRNYTNASSNQFVISGLAPDKTYTLRFFSSIDNRFGLNANPTVFVVNNNLLNQRKINAGGNTSEVVIFRGVSPSVSGEIPFFVGAEYASSVFGMLNGLIVEQDSAGGVNLIPEVDAGQDRLIELPTSKVMLSASVSDPDGEIQNVQWTKISGPAATINDPSLPQTTVVGLVEGVYVFRCTATDNKGGQGYDDLTVTVTAPTNNPKVRFAFSMTAFTEAGWNVLAGIPHTATLSTSTLFEGNTVSLSTGAWTPFRGSFSAAQTGENINDGGGMVAPIKVLEGNFFNINVYSAASPQIIINNLPAGNYKITLFGSISSSTAASLNNIDCRTIYRVNDSAPIEVNNKGNTSQTAIFSNISVVSEVSTKIYVTPAIGGSDNYVASLNAIVIEKLP